MKHRRRLHHTQTVKRRQHTQTRKAFTPPKKKSRFPVVFLIVIAIGAVAYLFQSGIVPLPEIPFLTDSRAQTTDRPEAKPKIPTEEKPAQKQVPRSPLQRQIQLEILNGCGKKGIADKLARLLRKKNYDVVNKGNFLRNGKTDWNVAETRIIDQIGQVDNARELADAMGVLYSNVESYENPSPIADITIIIGKDFKTLPIFNPQEQEHK